MRYRLKGRSLAIGWSDAQISILLHSIDSLQRLEYLNLNRTILTERALPLLTRQLIHLRELEFEYIPEITLEDGTNLADCAFLCDMRHSESVRLNFSLDYAVTPNFAASLGSCTQLTELTIREAVIESSLLTAALLNLGRLERLALDGVTLPSLEAFSSVPHLATTPVARNPTRRADTGW
jgi:hypothetical protein